MQRVKYEAKPKNRRGNQDYMVELEKDRWESGEKKRRGMNRRRKREGNKLSSDMVTDQWEESKKNYGQ